MCVYLIVIFFVPALLLVPLMYSGASFCGKSEGSLVCASGLNVWTYACKNFHAMFWWGEGQGSSLVWKLGKKIGLQWDMTANCCGSQEVAVSDVNRPVGCGARISKSPWDSFYHCISSVCCFFCHANKYFCFVLASYSLRGCVVFLCRNKRFWH